jgi:hypothetical protein
MVQAVEEILGDRIAGGCVNVKYGYTLPHPAAWTSTRPGIPSRTKRASLAPADPEILSWRLARRRLVLCWCPAGGSALRTLPAQGNRAGGDAPTHERAPARRGHYQRGECCRKHLES